MAAGDTASLAFMAWLNQFISGRGISKTKGKYIILKKNGYHVGITSIEFKTWLEEKQEEYAGILYLLQQKINNEKV